MIIPYDYTPVQQRWLKERQELLVKCDEAEERSEDLHCQLKATRDSLICCESSAEKLQAQLVHLQQQTKSPDGTITHPPSHPPSDKHPRSYFFVHHLIHPLTTSYTPSYTSSNIPLHTHCHSNYPTVWLSL